MQNNDITRFSDAQVLAAPPRQPLYRVEPKSFDGRYLECVSSYISSVAADHGTSPNIFLRDIVGVAADEFLDKQRGAFAAKQFAQSLDGRTDFSIRFLAMLSRLTGCKETEKHSLYWLNSISSRRGFLRSHLAWSPAFLDMVTKPYIPILWRLQWIKVCSKFRAPLNLLCPACGKEVKVISARGNVGYCTDYGCQADLSRFDMRGKSSTTVDTFKCMDYEVWVSDQTECLLESLRTNPLPESYSFSDTLNFWFDKFDLSGQRAVGPRKFGVMGNSLGLWLRGEQRPKVEHMFNFAWVFQLGIEDFLRKRVPERHDGKLVESLAVLPREGTGRPRRGIDKPRIRNRLRQIIQNEEFYYDSFNEISKIFGHSAGSLRQAFPEEAKKLGRRYRMNKNVRSRLRSAASMAEIAEACAIIDEMGQVISARRVKALVSKPSLIIDPKKGGALIKEARRRQLDGHAKKKLAN